MNRLLEPHGGKLLPLLLQGNELKSEKEKALLIPVLKMTSRETSDLIMMAIGAFSPLEGFMCKQNYDNVVSSMHLENGMVWPIPITLSVQGTK